MISLRITNSGHAGCRRPRRSKQSPEPSLGRMKTPALLQMGRTSAQTRPSARTPWSSTVLLMMPDSTRCDMAAGCQYHARLRHELLAHPDQTRLMVLQRDSIKM